MWRKYGNGPIYVQYGCCAWSLIGANRCSLPIMWRRANTQCSELRSICSMLWAIMCRQKSKTKNVSRWKSSTCGLWYPRVLIKRLLLLKCQYCDCLGKCMRLSTSLLYNTVVRPYWCSKLNVVRCVVQNVSLQAYSTCSNLLEKEKKRQGDK